VKINEDRVSNRFSAFCFYFWWGEIMVSSTMQGTLSRLAGKVSRLARVLHAAVGFSDFTNGTFAARWTFFD